MENFTSWKIKKDTGKGGSLLSLTKNKNGKTKNSFNTNNTLREKDKNLKSETERLISLPCTFSPMFKFEPGKPYERNRVSVKTEIQKLHPSIQDFFLGRKPNTVTGSFGGVPIFTKKSNWTTGNSHHLIELDRDIQDLFHLGIDIRSILHRIHRITNYAVTYWRELTIQRKMFG